ncbi:sugar ABC transporter ATP-binding protein [Lichenifustis flavocetrariae]|uniref:Sugar ABC transporter ATP-binding protein n=1 Tax=Lichenifustis flavocetrariae TaxID=2949735 RepID=A0AA41YUE9_9HYPH|nr:sugar ABC transporter ATP-binding protein [Lichenifustis flavocetrariae]MCW6508759.1 sugar ABC transporter ATP-binding protein [Lichenifustis flavocetrariae]
MAADSPSTLSDKPVDGAARPLVSMRGISKSFGENRVLRDVDFEVSAGEVHALLGENGAGKSTLMKILMGVYRPDAGTVTLDGEDIGGTSVLDHLSHGIAMIFQELSLLPNLTVGDNILLGREPRRTGWRIDKRSMRRDAQTVIDRYGFPLRAGQLVRDLGFAQRQMVEVLKAVSRGARVLIMDEPTSSLSLREEEKLFAIIDELKARGMGIVYISHRMAEIFRLANRMSIVKDGQVIGPLDPAATSIRKVSELMSKSKPAVVDTAVIEVAAKPASAGVATALEVRGLKTARKLDDLSFTIAQGEIVGIAGLVGSGRSTLAKALFGLIPDARGRVTVGGQPLKLGHPDAAIAAGIAFVPEDRRLEGLVLGHSLSSNVALASLDKLLHRIGVPVVSDRKIADLFEDYHQKLGIVARRPSQLASELSGGNQQKVVFAKWLATKPRLLILDEPTNGVDVNAKADMRAIMRGAADSGVGVLLISSELDELTASADRILTLVDGRITRELFEAKDEAELRATLQADLAAMKKERLA